MDDEDKQVAAAKGAEVEQECEMSRLNALCLFSLRRALTIFSSPVSTFLQEYQHNAQQIQTPLSC